MDELVYSIKGKYCYRKNKMYGVEQKNNLRLFALDREDGFRVIVEGSFSERATAHLERYFQNAYNAQQYRRPCRKGRRKR